MPYSTVLFKSSGYTGSPGYTKLKFMGELTGSQANAAAAAGRAFLVSIANFMPTGVTYTCDTVCQSYSDAGVLIGEVPISSVPAQVIGSGGTSWPGGVGAVVYWLTGALNGGHRVKGRTYLVPLANGAYSTDGTLATTLVNALTTAATTLVGATPALAVNSRKLGQADRGDQTNLVIGSSVKDRTAFLRTRRT